MTKSQIFKTAHQLAKTFTGNYSACLSLALSEVYESLNSTETIETYETVKPLTEENKIQKFTNRHGRLMIEVKINNKNYALEVYEEDTKEEQEEEFFFEYSENEYSKKAFNLITESI